MNGWRICSIIALLTALAQLAGCPGGGKDGTATGTAATGGNTKTTAAPNGGQAAPEESSGPVFDPSLTLNEQYNALKERQHSASVTEMMEQMKGITASGIFNNRGGDPGAAVRAVNHRRADPLDTEITNPVVLVFFRGGW
jgi:hypothetical protein